MENVSVEFLQSEINTAKAEIAELKKAKKVVAAGGSVGVVLNGVINFAIYGAIAYGVTKIVKG